MVPSDPPGGPGRRRRGQVGMDLGRPGAGVGGQHLHRLVLGEGALQAHHDRAGRRLLVGDRLDAGDGPPTRQVLRRGDQGDHGRPRPLLRGHGAAAEAAASSPQPRPRRSRRDGGRRGAANQRGWPTTRGKEQEAQGTWSWVHPPAARPRPRGQAQAGRGRLVLLERRSSSWILRPTP